jgi:hypothetical protein
MKDVLFDLLFASAVAVAGILFILRIVVSLIQVYHAL